MKGAPAAALLFGIAINQRSRLRQWGNAGLERMPCGIIARGLDCPGGEFGSAIAP
jgi:hypothetical protein